MHLSGANLALLLFGIVYLLIILEERLFHRSVTALIGGTLAIILGLLTPEHAWASIDYNTIFLLTGMMMIVSMLTHVGFFNTMAKWSLKLTGPNPRKIMVVFATMTAFLSMFLDNVTTVLFMTPIMINVARALELNVIPYLILLVIFSNIGGTATLIGDPPNILIGSIGKYSFLDFIVNVSLPVILAGSITLALALVLTYINPKLFNIKDSYDIDLQQLKFDTIVTHDGREVKLEPNPLGFKLNVAWFILTVLFFFVAHKWHIEPGVVALFMGSTLLGLNCLLIKADHKKVILDVEWPTLLFFVGLFIVVGALEEKGVLNKIANTLAHYISDNPLKNIFIIGSFSALVSGIVDNIPFTMAMSMILKEMSLHGLPHIPNANPRIFFEHLWWALSIGACFGGNLTLIGASANVVTADVAAKKGYKITFWEYLKWGVPFTVISTGLGLFILYLWLKIIGTI